MKTAIEKLAFEIYKLDIDLRNHPELFGLINEALGDERFQIKKAYYDGNEDGLDDNRGDSSEYYKFTYNK